MSATSPNSGTVLIAQLSPIGGPGCSWTGSTSSPVPGPSGPSTVNVNVQSPGSSSALPPSPHTSSLRGCRTSGFALRFGAPGLVRPSVPLLPSIPPSGTNVKSRDWSAFTGNVLTRTVGAYGPPGPCSVCTTFTGSSASAVPAVPNSSPTTPSSATT